MYILIVQKFFEINQICIVIFFNLKRPFLEGTLAHVPTGPMLRWHWTLVLRQFERGNKTMQSFLNPNIASSIDCDTLKHRFLTGGPWRGSRAGGGNMRPAGHIRPTKAIFLALNLPFDWNVARETLIKERCGPRTKIVAHPWSRGSVKIRKVKHCTHFHLRGPPLVCCYNLGVHGNYFDF